MSRQRESNPHFLPRHNDPIIDFPSRQPQPRTRPPLPHPSRTPIEPPHGPTPQPRSRTPPPHQSRTSIEPPHGPTPQPPTEHRQPQVNLSPPHQPHQDSTLHSGPHFLSLGPYRSGRAHRHNYHHDSSLRQVPKIERTRPIAWLVAAFCAIFWMIVIIGGLIILIVYVIFRPQNPRFNISSATLNAAYLDMGYLLNADFAVLANFTNPNTKVNVDFRSIIFNLYYDRYLIATHYVRPFSVIRGQSHFVNVHLVTSQVRLSMARSLQLQRQIESGRINFEIRGFFKTRSRLGGIFRYTYYLYAHCQIVVTGPPTGILIVNRCVTKR